MPLVKPGKFRIIGGQWRGRRFPIPALDQVRPTPDRVRETLFNWLANMIVGARCLDLFAGSGALGLEAVSRGAAEVVMVDRCPKVIAHLRAIRQSLPAAPIDIVAADITQPLSLGAGGFDVVFLDPPFRQQLLPRILPLLVPYFSQHCSIYVESEAETPLDPGVLPNGFTISKAKQAGQVAYYLLRNDE